jgi:photosystem II stability/assembly factor-like uncharacterized protein
MRTYPVLVLLMFAVSTVWSSSVQGQWKRTNFTDGSPAMLYANGSLYVAQQVIYQSSDDGDVWVRISPGPSDLSVQSLGLEDGFMFAGTYDQNGIFKSADSGIHWTQILGDFKNYVVTCFGAVGNILFLGTGYGGGPYYSVDSGNTWSNDANGFLHKPPFSIPAIQALVTMGSTILCGTYADANDSTGGVYRSSDTGRTWVTNVGRLSNRNVDALAVRGNILFAGTGDSGVYRSLDSGRTWSQVNNGLTSNQVQCLIVFDSNLLAGTMHDGLFLSTNNGNSWAQNGLAGIGVVNFAMSSDFLFAGTYANGVWRRLISDFAIVKPSATTPGALTFHPNYPNPLSTQTTLSLSNPRRQFVDVRMMDILGKQCAEIFSGNLDAGEHSFEWNASGVPDGVYFCIVRSTSGVVERAVVVRH